MGAIQDLARELGAEERTLRRAAAIGALHAHRPGPRRLSISDEERSYLRSHWPLLSQLRRALRVRPQVRFALLYGSAARGDDSPDSDLDLLVALADDDAFSPMQLSVWLANQAGRNVDVARLDRVSAESPLFLLQALDEGRVIIDREELWPRLRVRRKAIRARANRQYEREMKAVAEVLDTE